MSSMCDVSFQATGPTSGTLTLVKDHPDAVMVPYDLQRVRIQEAEHPTLHALAMVFLYEIVLIRSVSYSAKMGSMFTAD